MQKLYSLNFGKSFLLAGVLLFSAQLSKAQSVYLPSSYQLYQKFNGDIYSVKSSFHTSLRPFLIDSLISHTYDSVLNVGVSTDRKSWLNRKIFNEHLFDVQTKDYTFYGDVLVDLQAGKDFKAKRSTNLNTRGFQFGGTVGTKFSFYTSGFEDQGKFADYYNDVVNANGFIPGQAYARHYNGQKQQSQDWSYVTAILSYTPIKQLNITLGEDKMFVGDGYRSLLLSDYAANMPLLRATVNLGAVQYMATWAYLEDFKETKFDVFGSNRRKWALFHYLDWNVSNRVSFGFFNAVITPEADAQGNRRGFDLNFINPVLFSSSQGPSAQPKDNVLVGFTGKYKIFDKTAIYGQLLLDKFKGSDFFSGNNADNTNGFQLGVRGADIFKVERLNYLFEFNTVKPYTYSNQQSISSYAFYGDPLAHPLGANFREFLGIVNYSIGRFDFQGQLDYAKYGLDALATDNNGKAITKPFEPTENTTTTIGQGLNTQLYYAEGTVSFLINPKYNLRFELSGLYRQEKNSVADNKTTLVTFGLRSSFRNLYHDF
ncbi:protein involved in gliding motility RemB [Mucilaginibacter pineti]|uniref:Protein involved in gliding motility RemB n=1 Tax=Mucilaginibacter pineti TaxID=1391627 RepID=A0A1G6TBD1_9SPHI|nr:gliding motility protein RemB [Mucilaginibacter pineti]SDD26371.1 protein involved in gliding motility RemB [Mucilaginibacter pineti]